jgi:signal transduction protein with GAF and PtsI domain
MNKKKIVSILIILTMVMATLLSACNKAPKTIEEYLANDPDAMDEIKKNAEKSGLEVSVSGNDITYSYDISSYEDMTEEMANNETVVKALGDALDDSADNFSDLCKKLEEESNIEGVRIIVRYNYGDKELVSKTYTSSGIAESEESGGSGDSGESDNSEGTGESEGEAQ